MKSMTSFFVLLLLLAASAQASVVEGFWTGTAVRGGESVPISMRVETAPNGLRAYYNIPSLSLEGVPLPNLAFDPVTGALTASHDFKGIVQQSRITGKLSPALLD